MEMRVLDGSAIYKQFSFNAPFSISSSAPFSPNLLWFPLFFFFPSNLPTLSLSSHVFFLPLRLFLLPEAVIREPIAD